MAALVDGHTPSIGMRSGLLLWVNKFFLVAILVFLVAILLILMKFRTKLLLHGIHFNCCVHKLSKS